MKTNTRDIRTLATRCKLLGLAAALALGFCAAGVNAAHASDTPTAPAQPSQPPHVTIVPDANPIYLPAGQTQGTAGVMIQASGGPGSLVICMTLNGGAYEIPIATTPVVSSHQQVPVSLVPPNTVRVYWYPQQQGNMQCRAGGGQEVAFDDLRVLPAVHVIHCDACGAEVPAGTLAEAAP
jgi:hypothetical protein